MKLINDDCTVVMETLINNEIKVDLILTDPPYIFKEGGFGGGINELSKRNLKQDIKKNKLDVGFNIPLLFNQWKQLLNKMNICIFCAEEQMIDICNYAREQKYNYTVLIWHKTNPTPLCNNRYLNSIEFCVHVREKGVKINGNYKTKSKVFTSSVNKKDKKLYKHPTIKPLPFVEQLILNHSNKNDLILDCFMGSGTTGVACLNMSREFIGIEKDETYFEVAKNRIENHKVQQSLGI